MGWTSLRFALLNVLFGLRNHLAQDVRDVLGLRCQRLLTGGHYRHVLNCEVQRQVRPQFFAPRRANVDERMGCDWSLQVVLFQST